MTDLELDGDGLEQWIRGRRSRWVRQAYRILRSHEEAEDVVQETLMAVLAQKRDIRRLDAYVSRAVDWNAVKHRSRHRALVSLDSVPEVRAENQLDAFELEQALEGLPPAQQTVIRLRFYLGLTFAEIGNSLSISMNTAASRCRYALANLQRLLRPAAEKGEHDE